MKAIRSLLFIFIFCNSITAQENTIGTVFIDTSSYDGYTFFSAEKNAYLVDRCGRTINKWESSFKNSLSAYLLDNGELLRTATTFDFYSRGGIIEKLDWEGNLLWRYTVNEENLFPHHDVAPLPNGNILVLCFETKTPAEAWEVGAKDSIDYWSTSVIEIEPIGEDSANVVWRWNLWDHVVQELDSTRNNYGVVSEHRELMNINEAMQFPGEYTTGYGDPGPDWMHMNSIDYNAERDEILLSSRDQNEIYIIDHSTTTSEAASHSGGNKGKGGDIIFRYAGSLYGQHDAHWVENDDYPENTILLFNNGFRYHDQSRRFSSVDYIIPFLDENQNYVDNEIVEFKTIISFKDHEDEIYSTIMGSAQILPNGNTLVCSSEDGIFYEHDASGKKVWEYRSPLIPGGPNTQGNFESSLPYIFRAKKISKNDSRLQDISIVLSDPIEKDFNISKCLGITNTDELDFVSPINIYPNPTSSILNIESEQQPAYYELYNMQGNFILSNLNVEQIDMSELQSGVYILRLFYKSSVLPRNFMVTKI